MPAQSELQRNRCRSQRIDVWQQAVDTELFHPRYRSDNMRARMSGGRQESVILTYVGRLGAGEGCLLSLTGFCSGEVGAVYDKYSHLWSTLTGSGSGH